MRRTLYQMLAKMLLCREAAAAVAPVGPLGAALFWTSLWAQSGAVLHEKQANRFDRFTVQ